MLCHRQVRNAPGRIRTCDFCLRRAALYPLSYGRLGLRELSVGNHADRGHLGHPHAARQPRAARPRRRGAARGRRDPPRRATSCALEVLRDAAAARPAGARRPRQRRRRGAAADAAGGARGRAGRRADRDGPRRRAAAGPARAHALPLQGRRRGGLRPQPPPAPRGGRGRLPDLQPRLADRAPLRAHAHDGDRHRGGRARAFRADRRSSLRAAWTSRSSSPAPPARCRPRAAACPRCCCAPAATASCSTAARAPSSSCCARSGCRSSTSSSSPTTTSTTGSGSSGSSRRSTCAGASGR